MHDGEMRRIEEQFAQSTKLGLVEIQQKYRQKLKSNISVTYERFLTKNENIKVREIYHFVTKFLKTEC